MAGAPIEQALARIEAALARIETAASRAPHDEDLQARHDRLRHIVSQSLRQLDELLAGHAP